MTDMEHEELEKKLKEILKVAELTASTKDVLEGLTAREARLLGERIEPKLVTDPTLEEVQKQFELTEERIRQIEAKALKKLRGKDDDPDGDDPNGGSEPA